MPLTTELFWEPPEQESMSTILSEFNRTADNELLRNGFWIRGRFIDQAVACILIEKFVDRVLANGILAYSIVRFTVRSTSLSVRMRYMIRLVGFFDSSHHYSEKITAFLHAVWFVECVEGLNLTLIEDDDFQPTIGHAEALNLLVERIRLSARREWFKRAHIDRKWEAKYKSERIRDVTQQMLMYYSRINIVRVDLSYLENQVSPVSIDLVYDHLEKLLSLKNYNQIFYGLVNYVWSVEQGRGQGFHLHLIFYFDGSKMRADANKGFEIGRLWSSDITQGLGKAFNCNYRKEERYGKDRNGIGMVDRMDDKACLNAIEELTYLAKDSQYLRIKPEGRRVFGAGISPNITQKTGRPPRQLPAWPDQLRGAEGNRSGGEL